MSETAARAMRFILSHLAAAGSASRPLFVGLQGPQGSGKSYLADVLQKNLSSMPHNLKVVTLSLDDLYLPHSQMHGLAREHPATALLQGRGLPGTHDLELGEHVLRHLALGEPVSLPIYDKSAHDGAGDRSKDTLRVNDAADVVLFEGWMLGFLAIASPAQLRTAYDALATDAYARQHSFEIIVVVDELLAPYELRLWSDLDVMISLRPKDPHYTWKWRLEQEHAMKAKNGGRGMTDEQVKAFVDRYAPAYEIWDFSLHTDRPLPWADTLLITLDEHRNAINTS